MNAGESNDTNKQKEEGYEVLKLFGMRLKVKDRKIADLLTTNVHEDVSTFRQKLGQSAEVEVEEAEEAVVEMEEIASSEQFGDQIRRIGMNLGFDVGLGGIWRSSTGMAILLRRMFERPSFESAKAEVDNLSRQQKQIKTENAGLFVTRDTVGCDILKAAIRSRNLYHLMRVISYENLCGLMQLKDSGYLKHRQVVTLMVPIDNVDVGELLNVVKAVAVPTTLEEYLSRKQE